MHSWHVRVALEWSRHMNSRLSLRCRIASLGIMCLIPVSRLFGQGGTVSAPVSPIFANVAGQPFIDSATVARDAYGAASRATTLDGTLAALLRASRAWPTQPAYWTATARIAARAGDTAAVIEALTALTGMHTGRGLINDSAVQTLALVPAVRVALNALERATPAVVAGKVIATLDSTVFAEGIDASSRTGMLYVASIRHGTIFEIDTHGAVRDLHVSRHSKVGAILGVRVSPNGLSLFATTTGLPTTLGYTPRDSSLAAILQIRIADGAIEQRWDVIADGERHLLGDVAVAADGTVYASDSYAPNLLRIRPGAATYDVITHPLFRSLQGIAPTGNAEFVIVADYSHGLMRVNVVTHSVHRIADAPGSSTLGLDGIVWYKGAVIGVQNGMSPARIMQFTFDSTMSRVGQAAVIDHQPDMADEPTIGTLFGDGFIYVANSQWGKYDDAGVRRAGTSLQPTRLICVPLRRWSTAPTSPKANQSSSLTERNGTRNTASAPPVSSSCSASDAPPE